MSLKKVFLTVLSTVSVAFGAVSQKYVDASTLRVINRGWDSTHLTFSRLPSSLKTEFNETAWYCSMHSAGVAIRFATNSRNIGVRYTLHTNTHMNHQAPTGTKGVDLYILNNENKWRHVNAYRPADQRQQEGWLCEQMDGTWHECMIYLPLYDGVTAMDIKIDESAEITDGNYDAIDATKRVVAYGTSILQGGCATRTGMVATSILSRDLNCEFINLGFSGGGKMEITAAQAIAAIPNVSAFVIDPVPNCDADMCRDLTYDFVKTIRDANPGVPVIMVEGPMYPYAAYNTYFAKYLPEKNANYYANYLKLLEDDPTNLYYVTCENLDGPEDDGTIDGIHLSDVGFIHYADKLRPVLESFVTGTELMTITSIEQDATNVPLTPSVAWNKPERTGHVEIATLPTFSRASIVYTADGTGSVDVPRYTLGSSTKYYARVAYNSSATQPDNVSYTPYVAFTTEAVDVPVPSIAYPVDGGTLHANEVVSFDRIDGITSLRLEISTSTTFTPRSSYIAGNITTSTWADTKTGAEIRVGGAALQEGQTYYARVRAAYNTPDGSATTAYSEPITFIYSATPGSAASVDADNAVPVAIETYDMSGRAVTPRTGQPTLTVTRMSDGSQRVTKSR